MCENELGKREFQQCEDCGKECECVYDICPLAYKDWEAVGQDMQKAMDNFDRQQHIAAQVMREDESLLRRFGRANIRHTIQRMILKFHEKYGRRPKIICFDHHAEVRLAANLMYDSMVYPDGDDSFIEVLLERGVRGKLHMKMYGLEMRFDCPEFCVSD